MKKRVLSLLLITALLLQGFINSPKTASAATNTSTPTIGDVISGFTVKQITTSKSTQSTNILLTHNKTGAKMLVIKNSDLNRGFAIGFNTPAQNNKGINHIIEHSVLGGSDKYPLNNMIFNVMNTTYTSFINAFTYQNMTMYPVCSASEEQLMKLTDVYMDSVYHPLLLKNKNTFLREGWRYELADTKSDLNLNGVVYNEMRGTMENIQTAAYYNAKKSIFPNTNQGNLSGGDPQAIPSLTYEEVLTTYKKYYHPSNSMMVLYGDVDYSSFLKMLDKNYLSSFKKLEITTKRETQKPFTKLQEKNYTFPVAANTDTKNKSVISITFATSDLKKLGVENYVGLSLIASLLNTDTSSFKKSLANSGIAESYSVSVGADTYQPIIMIAANNADPSKKKEFYNLVMKELKNTVKSGIDKELVKSVVASSKFENVIPSGSEQASKSLINALLYNSVFGDPTLDFTPYYYSIEKKLNTNYLEKLIDTHLVKNKLVSLVTTSPKAGLLEKNATALNKQLKATKASMSTKDLNALVKATKEFNAINTKEATKEQLASIKAVSAKDIPVEVKDYTVDDTKIDGVRILSAKADVAEVGQMSFIFDVSHLTKEELFYLNFYSSMINSGMPTKNRTESQVLNEQVSTTYSFSTSLSATPDNALGTTGHPVFTLSYLGFTNEFKNTLSLASDILLQSDMTDIKTYAARTLSYLKTNYSYTFGDPYSFGMMRTAAYSSPLFQYINYLTGIDYYNFLLQLEADLTKDPAALRTKLESVRDKAFCKKSLSVVYAGNKASIDSFYQEVPSFIKPLSTMEYPKASYTLPVPAKREAIATNSTVQYVIYNSSLSKNGLTPNGGHDVATLLLTNLLLIPELRLKSGAYDARAMFMMDNYIASTYRDANYFNSLNIINNTDSFINSILPYLDANFLESYILSTFATANSSSGELYDAFTCASNKRLNYTTSDRIKYLNEIKNVTPADIKQFVTDLSLLNKNANYTVIAPPALIEEHKDMFDQVITLP